MEYEHPKGRLILGSGRSGTTWVQDCLADANELRPIFEPLNEAESDIGRRYAYETIRPGDRHEALEQFFLRLASGELHSRWIDYRGPRQFLFPPLPKLMTVRGLKSWARVWRRYLRDRSQLRASVNREETLIKCIRANLMAGWFAKELGFRTALLLRHPCAVVESQFRLLKWWHPSAVRERYRSNQLFHEITDGRYLPLLSSPLDEIQALTLNWVIENQRPLQRASAEGYSVFFYERLLKESSSEWASICHALELPSLPSNQRLLAPSQQTYETADRNNKRPRTVRWKENLTSDQRMRIQGILDATECAIYDVDNELPLIA